MPRRVKPKPGGKIEKPEDKAWNEWFNSLDVKEHEKHLAQLGLDKEDIEEWEEVEGFKETKKEEAEAVKKLKKKKD